MSKRRELPKAVKPKPSSLPLYKRGRTLEETIEAYSIPVPECGCWIWIGAAGDWHGTFKYHGESIGAHCGSWRAYKGPIPTGMFVCHSCDVPLCVNPDHLFLGTALDNVRDMMRKGRGHKARGRQHGRNKITPEQAIEIRLSKKSHRALADDFRLSCGTISSIKNNKIWTWL